MVVNLKYDIKNRCLNTLKGSVLKVLEFAYVFGKEYIGKKGKIKSNVQVE